MRTILTLIVILMIGHAFLYAQETPDDPYQIVCPDGQMIIGYRYHLADLAPGGPLRITLLGSQTFDPVLVQIESNGSITCSDNSNLGTGTAVVVPTANIQGNAFSVQRTILAQNDGSLDLLVGGYAGQSGQFALVIENNILDALDDVNTLQIQIPPAAQHEVIGVSMIGTTEPLNPLIVLLDDSQNELMRCDNAATQTCPNTPTLVERGVQLSENTIYAGDALDAGIVGVFDMASLNFELSSSNVGGGYLLIVTGTAPGDTDDSRFICDAIETSIKGTSPTLNALYAPENILDGDPKTVWVSDFPVDPETSIASSEVFIVLEMESHQRVSKIRVNGYASLVAQQTNSLRAFSMVVNNVDGTAVTALQAELRLLVANQEFTFLPIEVQELGFVFRQNFGGSLLEVADIQVCAAD